MCNWRCVECREEGDEDWKKEHDKKYSNSPCKPKYVYIEREN